MYTRCHGKIEVKGKGRMLTYWVGPTSSRSRRRMQNNELTGSLVSRPEMEGSEGMASSHDACSVLDHFDVDTSGDSNDKFFSQRLDDAIESAREDVISGKEILRPEQAEPRQTHRHSMQ